MIRPERYIDDELSVTIHCSGEGTIDLDDRGKSGRIVMAGGQTLSALEFIQIIQKDYTERYGHVGNIGPKLIL